MRSLVLILALVVGQVHACAVAYFCSSGEVCRTCEAPPYAGESAQQHQKACATQDDCGALASTTDDCRDCCELTTCPDAGQTKLGAPSVFAADVAAILPSVVALPSPARGRVPWAIKPVKAHRSHAPPGIAGSRAPPSSSVKTV